VPATVSLEPPVVPRQPSGAAMRVLQMSLNDALQNESLRTQWAAFHDRSPDAHPLLHPDCVEASFSDGTRSREAAPFVHAILTNERLECLGVLDPWTLPVVSKLKWKRSGWRLFAKSLSNRDVGVADVDNFELSPRTGGDEAQECNTASGLWLRSLMDGSGSRDVRSLYIEALDRNSALYQQLQNGSRDLIWMEPGPLQPRWRLQLPGSVDEYWQQQFSRRSRNTLRRKKKKIKGFQLQVATQPEHISAFLRAANAVSRETWQSRQLGLRIRNDERELRLFTALAERGAFRGYVLVVDERPIAFVYLTSHNGVIHNEETGYVADMAQFSPGLVLLSEVVDDVIATGQYDILDFGLGHAFYKELLANQESQSEDAWLLRPGLATSLDCAAIRLQQRSQSLAKASLARAGVLRIVKRWRRRA
jgi:Acetyltransferase (GNAT) domain